jgi:hypothetical protein
MMCYDLNVQFQGQRVKKSPALKHTFQVATDIRLVCYTFILAVKSAVKISVWLSQNYLKVSELWDLYFSLTCLKMCAEIIQYFMLENVFLRGFNFINHIMVTYMSNRSDIYIYIYIYILQIYIPSVLKIHCLFYNCSNEYFMT